ncbi:hypothetical protein FVER53590_10180 [Fusarium verticillioides]|nr:hypothetical protein FVER53590_10180 [Fusarium verticillioides]
MPEMTSCIASKPALLMQVVGVIVKAVDGISLAYLSYDDFAEGAGQSGSAFEHRLHKYILLDYCAKNWADHVPDVLDEEVDEAALEFLEDDQRIANAAQVRVVTGYHFQRYSVKAPIKIGAVHIVAQFGLPNIVSQLLDGGVEANVKDDLGSTPLNTCGRILCGKLRISKLRLVAESLFQQREPTCLAAVSRAWQTDVERYNFSHIRLTPSRLMDFRSMILHNQGLVRYIWFFLELDEYDCTQCAPRGGMVTTEEMTAALTVSDTEHRSITTAFQGLFSVLSEWDQDSNLMLDISIYSPSDAQHWFPYLTLMPDSPSNRLEGSGLELTTTTQSYHDPPHGWVAGFRQSAPHPAAVRKAFHFITEEEAPDDDDESEFQWWDQLPSVSSVTSILLRQQSRRRWEPGALTHMLARFPRLQEIHYEPWREWDDFSQRITDKVEICGCKLILAQRT